MLNSALLRHPLGEVTTASSTLRLLLVTGPSAQNQTGSRFVVGNRKFITMDKTALAAARSESHRKVK